MLSFCMPDEPAGGNDSMAQPGCMLSFNIPEDNCVTIGAEDDGQDQDIGIELPYED